MRRLHPSAPIRIAHIGLGAFFKAHQAFYTSEVDEQHDWGIAAFSGRGSEVVKDLNSQDCVYTLIERDFSSDQIRQIESISAAYEGSNEKMFCNLFEDEKLAIVTITITEAGYRLNSNGDLNRLDPVIQEDLSLFSDNEFPSSALFRIAFGLRKRMIRNSGKIAIIPCDNFPNNGETVKRAVYEIFNEFEESGIEWLEENVSFVSTSVDRITPKLVDSDRAHLSSRLGIKDKSIVVTENYSSWVLCGSFPNGRPEWEKAGAEFVTDIKPYESRKLWFLNGAHSLIAYQGLNKGYMTVGEAIQDSEINHAVECWWDEAEKVLINPALELTKYRSAIMNRFRNPSIRHELAQIAIDGSIKLPLRILPVARQTKTPTASAFVIAQWIKWVSKQNDLLDTRNSEIQLVKNSLHDLIKLLDPRIADSNFTSLVRECLESDYLRVKK